jgi:hypothetical protein
MDFGGGGPLHVRRMVGYSDGIGRNGATAIYMRDRPPRAQRVIQTRSGYCDGATNAERADGTFAIAMRK